MARNAGATVRIGANEREEAVAGIDASSRVVISVGSDR